MTTSQQRYVHAGFCKTGTIMAKRKKKTVTFSLVHYRIRGGGEGEWWLAPREVQRFGDMLRDLKLGGREKCKFMEFMVVDTHDRRYAVNPDHLVYVQFAEQTWLRDPATREEENEETVCVTFTDGHEKTFHVDGDQEEFGKSDDDDEALFS